jgi:MoaA/NifB/PqqE/SkfB family radical SAM enzyme
VVKQNKYSDYKIFSFPDKIASFRDDIITAPIYVRIKPTNICNHACRFCVYSDGTTRPKDRPDLHLQAGMHTSMNERDVMPRDKALELIEDLATIGTKAVTFSGGGEPLLHKDIVEIMTKTVSSGLDLSIITNGQLLAGERAEVLGNAKWVRISMDYTSAEQMASSRNVPDRSFDSVMQNIKNFSNTKTESCDLGINFIITRYNYEGLVPFAKQLKDAGVSNVRFSPVYVQNFKEYHNTIATRVREQLAECQSFCDDDFTINTTYDLDSPSKSSVRPFHRCLYAQAVCVVGADLNIYACHNTAYSNHGRIASMKDQSFSQAWFGEEAKAWHKNFNPGVSCLHECANHAKVALFEKLATDSHDAFV